MRNVMCINHDDFEGDCYSWDDRDPQIGSDYEIVRTTIGTDKKGNHFPSYIIKGFNRWAYDQRNFATLPDQDADEMAEVEKEGIANLEPV